MRIRNILVILIAFATIYAAANSEKRVVPKESFDVNTVVFIEDEAELGLGFDTAKYLPENFDPYCGEFSVKTLNYIEDNDEIELGFETSGYLPIGFDPYIQ